MADEKQRQERQSRVSRPRQRRYSGDEGRYPREGEKQIEGLKDPGPRLRLHVDLPSQAR